MTGDDAPAVFHCMTASFADLEERLRLPVTPPPSDPGPALVRIRHLVDTDPGGAWLAEDDQGVAGAALALVREGIWGLSLLVVRPGVQSQGTGSALLRAALEPAAGTRGGIILASEDARALRAYSRAGFELRPAMDARGTVRGPLTTPEAVREARWPEDRELIDATGRALRGAGHGQDIPAWLAAGQTLLVHERGGFAVHSGGTVRCVAAVEETAAGDLLRAALARSDGEAIEVNFLTAGQDWAVRVLHDAGLQLRPGGAVAVRGDVGPLRPYIPSGSYL
jgi:GNAT superfamily N-acetyltransferase